MVERQTKENLRKVLEDELQLIGVSLEQLLTITHDNGANMLAAVRLLRALLEYREDNDDVPLSSIFLHDEILQSMEQYANDDSDEGNDDFEESIEESVEESGEPDEPISDDFVDGHGDLEFSVQDEPDDDHFELLESIRCAAHTAQLAVWDVIKPYKERLSSINKSCIKMRHKQFQQLFKLHKVPLPPKVNETRWNVWYILLKYLRSLKDTPFLNVLQTQDSSLDLSRHWNFIDKFCDAFEPMFILTMNLQKDHVPLSQFYVDWLSCMAKLKAVKDNTLASKLYKAMSTRIEKLKSNMAFKACQYLDPRFNYSGSSRMTTENKADAQKYLIALSKRLDQLSGVDNRDTEEQDQHEVQNDLVEDFLAELFEEDNELSVPEREAFDSLLGELIKLESRKKVKIVTTSQPQPGTSKDPPKQPPSPTFDVLEYWKKKKMTSPRLYRLAKVILAVPSTQVTVERLFSQLKFILTDSRMRLADTAIKDLMLLKMNQDLLPKVVDQILEAGIL